LTYSIIALDRKNGLLGIAVASGSIAVGSRVPWAMYRVGGVATQAYTNPALGPIILSSLEKGYDAKTALEKALEQDPQREYRQVAVLDWKGIKAHYTGAKVPEEKNGWSGKDCVAIANLVSSNDIPEILCKAYQKEFIATNDLIKALLKALRTGHEAGGDKRGDRTSSILVVGKTVYGRIYDKIIDARVDYSREPIKELERIVEKMLTAK
jgi:uncharacterized Ntn-hydrolase superfamily protein